jgi:riboflavin-specific deaminase-like protein
MRALLPDPGVDVDPVPAYAIPPGAPADRPFVRCNMISTLDGAVTINGRSGMIGGPADRRVFQILRSWADVILVGAGTARAESYGPARLDDVLRTARADRGQSPVPPIAVVTRSANLDWSSAFFTRAEARPIVFTIDEIDVDTRRRGEQVADVVVAGSSQVEPQQALAYLHQAGHRSVLLEGGPGLNAELVQAALIDELCLTLAPRLVGGPGPRVLAGEQMAEPLELDLVHLLEEDGFLFARLAIRPASTGA